MKLEQLKSILKEFWRDLDYHTPRAQERKMTEEEQEAINQIKEVITTTLGQMQGNGTVSWCEIKVTWNLHKGDSEDFVRPDVEIKYGLGEAEHAHVAMSQAL